MTVREKCLSIMMVLIEDEKPRAQLQDQDLSGRQFYYKHTNI